MGTWLETNTGDLVDLDKFYKISFKAEHGDLGFMIIGETDHNDVVIDRYTADQKEAAKQDFLNIKNYLTR